MHLIHLHILKFSFLSIEIVEERGKAFIYDHLVAVFSECISVPYNERSHEEYTSTFLSSHGFEKRERGKAWYHQNTVYIFRYLYN